MMKILNISQLIDGGGPLLEGGGPLLGGGGGPVTAAWAWDAREGGGGRRGGVGPDRAGTPKLDFDLLFLWTK